MKVLICPDSFKGTFSALKVSEHIAEGVQKADPQVKTEIIPLADGGEGTLTALSSLLHIHKKKVAGPLGRNKKVSARYGIMKNDPGTAIIEAAEANGLHLVPEKKRNPLYTTTIGVGELIKAALDKECSKIIVGIGGSSTNDAGMGMAQSLGVKFFNRNHIEIQTSRQRGYCGESLAELHSIDSSTIDPRVRQCTFLTASDVQNPLHGKNGAAFVYASQKGASPSQVRVLDQGLKNFDEAVNKSLYKNIADLPGAGAAGGLGAGLRVFLDAKLISGIDFIMDAVQMGKYVSDSDVIITGEGRFDAQTATGKTIYGVLCAAKNHNKPVIVVAGSLGADYEKNTSKHISVIEDASRGIQKPLRYFKRHPELIREAACRAYSKWRKKV